MDFIESDRFFRDLSHRFLTRNTYELCISPAFQENYTNMWYILLMSSLHAEYDLISTDWILIPEYAEDQMGRQRIHWHGYIKLKDTTLTQLQTTQQSYLRKIFPDIRIWSGPIRNKKKYLLYMCKELEKTLKLLGKHSIHSIIEQRTACMNHNFFEEEEPTFVSDYRGEEPEPDPEPLKVDEGVINHFLEIMNS